MLRFKRTGLYIVLFCSCSMNSNNATMDICRTSNYRSFNHNYENLKFKTKRLKFKIEKCKCFFFTTILLSFSYLLLFKLGISELNEYSITLDNSNCFGQICDGNISHSNILIRNENDSRKHQLGDNSLLSGNNNVNSNSDEYTIKKDWFNQLNWEKYKSKKDLPKNNRIEELFIDNIHKIENICKYKDYFKVFDKRHLFRLNLSLTDLFGDDGDRTLKDNNKILYEKFFQSKLWEKEEFYNANCIKDDIVNHLVLLSKYPQMMGEWYVRTILPLYDLRKNGGLNSTDIKMYLINWENNPLFISHHLFIEPFTRYQLKSFIDLMLNQVKCVCFDRMFFFGFKKSGEIWRPLDNNLFILKNIVKSKNIKKEIIRFYKDSYRKIYPDVEKDSFFFKKQLIEEYVKRRVEIGEVHKYKLIGLYDRRYRRKWLNIQEICNKINSYKYFLCYKIILETQIGHLYVKNLLNIHNNLDLVVGVHGSQLADAIFIKENGFVIELLLEHSEDWTQCMDGATPLGEIFQGTKLFHVGLMLQKKYQFHNNKIITGKEEKKIWADSDFIVDWENDFKPVFDYLLFNGGPCNHDKNLVTGISNKFRKNLTEIFGKKTRNKFTIYNSFCP